MSPTKILIICTSADKLQDTATGLWAEELAAPYFLFQEAGFSVTVASTKGGEIPLDQGSLQGNFLTEAARKFLDDETCKQLIKASTPISSIKFEEFDAAFLPGGHGACVDFPSNATIKSGLEQMLHAGKVVGSVCHGPMCFVGLKAADGQPIVKGKKVTCFTDSEERAVGKEKLVPFLLESKLKELGGQFECVPDWHPFALRDGNLVSGQNPMSSHRTAELIIEALKK
ncbi:class I glutamine amidotransferase-like protein [Dunaliella salina]|uniref:Class I glutamine amidotransferase-like protein n=1 Tax=Dunaliella salina TaxID=3046 RepID=A0ABQ7FZV5_DUNSA|nr:class I glutamine amidotransferase-like protein [Dunaliella salina]|eukprot:KAF5827888.1 class I glutamine amidotransferase-like protein [Dunaliella salina]